MSRRWLPCLGIAVLWGGCTYVADVQTAAPEIAPDSLRVGRLAVLGVVQVDEVTQVRQPLIEAFERVWTGARRDIPLVRAGDAAHAMGDSTSRFLLLGYQMHGVPDSAWMARAVDSLRDAARYGLLARVESDVIRHSIRDAPAHSPEALRSGRIRVTGRDVRVSVHIYDLRSRVLAFAGTFTGSSEAVAPDTLPPVLPPPSGGISILPKESPQEYPEPPPVARPAEQAFLTFARSLPDPPR